MQSRPVSSVPRCTRPTLTRPLPASTRSAGWATSATSSTRSPIWRPPGSSPARFFTSTSARAPVTESIEIRAANHWHRLTSTIREPRLRGQDFALGYLKLYFAFTDRPVLTVYRRVIVRRTNEGWPIRHYQVPQLAEREAPTRAVSHSERADAKVNRSADAAGKTE